MNSLYVIVACLLASWPYMVTSLHMHMQSVSASISTKAAGPIIIGGGPAGLSTALMLAKRGINLTLTKPNHNHNHNHNSYHNPSSNLNHNHNNNPN